MSGKLKTVTLRVIEDRNGTTGLVVDGMSTGNETDACTDGRLLAHDLIEHVNGVQAIGSIDDELEALGAIWYVRGQHDDLDRGPHRNSRSGEENIAGDVTRMFADFFHGAHVTLSASRSRKLDNDAAEEAFAEIIRLASLTAPAEVSDNGDTLAAESEALERLAEYMRACLPRMRTGFRKARRMYEGRGRSRFAANSLFWEVADAVDNLLKQADIIEGAEYVLTYGFAADGTTVARWSDLWEPEE